ATRTAVLPAKSTTAFVECHGESSQRYCDRVHKIVECPQGSCQLPLQLADCGNIASQMNERAQEITSGLPPDLDALPRLGGFRLRGIAMTRLETFIDAAFAFAITMLVIATQQIPDDIETLLAAFKNVPAFVASIIVLGIFWRAIGCGAGVTAWRTACRSSLA